MLKEHLLLRFNLSNQAVKKSLMNVIQILTFTDDLYADTIFIHGHLCVVED